VTLDGGSDGVEKRLAKLRLQHRMVGMGPQQIEVLPRRVPLGPGKHRGLHRAELTAALDFGGELAALCDDVA